MTEQELESMVLDAAGYFGILVDDISLNPDIEDVNACAEVTNLTIGYSSELLEMTTGMILAVMAHELGHIAMGHHGSHHSEEYEADEQAVEIMQYWGINPLQLVKLWTKLGFEASDSHPGWQDRVENVNRIIRKMKL